MAGRRRARRAAFVVTATIGVSSAACNALTGAHDRQLEDDMDTGPRIARVDASDATVDPPDVPDGNVPTDGGPDVIFVTVSKTFTSPNGAVITTTAAGTSITGVGGASHPIIVPSPQPKFPEEDFTVYATVLAPNDGEFGVVTRLQTDGGAGVVYGSKFGGESKPFFGAFAPPDYNPSLDARGAAYTYVTNTRYNFKVKAVGNLISAKFWDVKQPEPALYQAVYSAPFATGRGIGFYTYMTNGAVLESLRVSIP